MLLRLRGSRRQWPSSFAHRRATLLPSPRVAARPVQAPPLARAAPPRAREGPERAQRSAGGAARRSALAARGGPFGEQLASLQAHRTDGVSGGARAIPPPGPAPVLRRGAQRSRRGLPVGSPYRAASGLVGRGCRSERKRSQRNDGDAAGRADAAGGGLRLHHPRAHAAGGAGGMAAADRPMGFAPAVRLRRAARLSRAPAPGWVAAGLARVPARRFARAFDRRLASRVRPRVARRICGPLVRSTPERAAVGPGASFAPVDGRPRVAGGRPPLLTRWASLRASWPCGSRSTPCYCSFSYGPRCGPRARGCSWPPLSRSSTRRYPWATGSGSAAGPRRFRRRCAGWRRRPPRWVQCFSPGPRRERRLLGSLRARIHVREPLSGLRGPRYVSQRNRP